MSGEPNKKEIKDNLLVSIVERIERLEEEKKAIADDIRDIYAQAKASGLEVKAIRQVIKLRKMDASEREEIEFLLDSYKQILGL